MQKKIIISLIILSALLVTGCGQKQTQPKSPSPVSQQQTPSPSQPSQPADKSGDWETYNNAEFAFEIKYPSDWKFEASPEGRFSIQPPDENRMSPILLISFSKEKYSKVLSREQAAFDEFTATNENLQEGPAGHIRNIMIGGRSAKEFLYYSPLGAVLQDIILENNDHSIIINSFENSILDPVLATLNFTNSPENINDQPW